MFRNRTDARPSAMPRLYLVLLIGVLTSVPAWAQPTLTAVSFRATFDATLDADLAAGRPTPKAVDGNVGYDTGRYGQALVAGEDGAGVSYRIERNLDTSKGALSFWFLPVNWTPGELRAHLFVHSPFAGIFRILNDEAGQLVFEIGTDLGQRRRVSAPLANCAQGEWVHVVVNWSAEALELFLNGKAAAKTPCEARFLPRIVNSNLVVGDLPHARGRETVRKTLIDDLTIYRRPMGADELGRVEATTGGKMPAYRPPAISVARQDAPIVVDGIADAEEWRQGAGFGNFLNVSDHKLAPLPTEVRIAHDGERLCFAVASPVLAGVPLKADSRRRDDQVWADDAVQIYLTPPHGDNRFHFVSNCKGVIFDRKTIIGIKHDPTWNGEWEVANRVADGTWTLEVAITFEALGVKPPANGEVWRLNVTRDRVAPQNLSCWPRLNAFGDADGHGYLRFSDAGPAVAVADFGSAGSRVNFDVAIALPPGAAPTRLAATLTMARSGTLLATERFTLEAAAGVKRFPIHVDAGDQIPDVVSFTVVDASGVEHYHDTAYTPVTGSLQLDATPIPSRGVCKVQLRERNNTVLAAKPMAVVELRPTDTPDAEAVRTVTLATLNGGSGAGEFDIASLPPGSYELNARLVSSGVTLDSTTAPFVKPPDPWRTAGVGKSDTPPPPWTPMTATGDHTSLTVGCWNREYQFNGSPVPTVIRNGDVTQLAAPMRLAARVDERELDWQERRITDVQHDDVRVSFSTHMRAGGITVDAQTYVEYDGMLWTDITVAPTVAKTAPTLDALELIVPVDARFASLRQIPNEHLLTGNTGNEDGWSWDYSARRYFLWIGNEDLGLTWFYEREAPFRHSDKAKRVGLELRNGVMYFKVRFVDHRITLAEPLTLSFGLQATPVKSRPAGWRRWGEPRKVGQSFHIPWTSEPFDRYAAGYPEATNTGFYRRFVQRYQRDHKFIPYKVLMWHGIDTPEYKYYGADWDLGGGINKYHDTRRHWFGIRVCGGAESFVDFMTWKMIGHIDEFGLDGAYHDLQWSYACANPNHGCAGSRRAIRGDRELNKRLYTAMKQRDRPLWKIDHASNGICSALHGFSDIFTTGEEMRLDSKPAKPGPRVWKGYFEAMRISYFKASGAMGRQWGVVPMFLLQMNSVGVKPAATEGIFSILLAHDAIPTWDALYKDVRFMTRVWRALEDFGIGEADLEFLPYWQASTPAGVSFVPDGGGPVRPMQVLYETEAFDQLQPEQSYGASIYHRPGKRSLVVVFNYTQDDGTAMVKLNLPALGFDPAVTTATDAFTRAEWVPANVPLAVRVKSENFRLLWIDDVAANATHFPDEATPALVAGTRPTKPDNSCDIFETVGDRCRDPWAPENRDVTGSELAQAFKLTRATKLERIEVNMSCTGSRGLDLREPVRLRIVEADADGMPTDTVVVQEEAFTPQWVIDYFTYHQYELKRGRVLPPGRYAIVLSKPPEESAEHRHYLLPAFEATGVFEPLSVRLRPNGGWQRTTRMLAYGVYGFEQ